MIELAVFIAIFGNPLVLAFLYSADRELKFLAQGGIQQHEQITLTKWKYLFVFSKRKDGIISKHAYRCMIAYYIVNGTGYVALLFLYIAKNDPFITISCIILAFANLGLLAMVGSQPRLTPVQEERKLKYMEQLAQEYKIKRQEKKQNKLKRK